MRRLSVLVGAMAVVVTAGVVVFGGGAGAASTSVSIMGSNQFVPNGEIASTYHFSPGTITVHSGATAQWVDATPEPHTITIVNASQLPATANQVFNCKVCQSQAPVANVGIPGLNTPGDSVLVRSAGSVSAPITAPPGTVLHYMCVFHAWMQGVINVT